MIVLGLETATIACGVALAGPDGTLGTIQVATRQTHSQRLMPLIDRLLAETGVSRADLGGVAVSYGPGSFTGLRIGVATAKAIALALALPVVGVPTLAALAANAGPAAGIVWPALVAKKDEVYGAVYRGGSEPILIGEPWACAPEELLRRAAAVGAGNTPWLVGDAYTRFADRIGRAAGGPPLLGPDAALPQAVVVARLGRAALLRGEGMDASALTPLYVRRPQAEIVWDARERQQEGDGSGCGA